MSINHDWVKLMGRSTKLANSIIKCMKPSAGCDNAELKCMAQ